MTLQDQFGNIDIYVFDQLLRGRIAPGCASSTPAAAAAATSSTCCARATTCAATTPMPSDRQVRALAASLRSGTATHDFRVEPIEQTSFPDEHADVVMASAVLHFARDEAHFEAMLRQLWRVLQPGGVFFARLASTIGIAVGRASRSAADGSACRRLRSLPRRCRRSSRRGPARLGGVLIDPIKTTVVHEQRSMTTWVADGQPSIRI